MRDIPTLLAELQEAIEAQTATREEGPGRVISRTAKTVMPGMMVEFPERGWLQVVGVTRLNGDVLLSNGGAAFWTVPVGDRVRTRNPI